MLSPGRTTIIRLLKSPPSSSRPRRSPPTASRRARSPKALRVSVMTLHRWRKLDHLGASAGLEIGHGVRNGRARADIVTELQMENRQLRRIVTDLLLEKVNASAPAQAAQFLVEETALWGKVIR